MIPNAPYLADSITEFWRRWHISLSTFLRDYLYVPLGGNRRGPARTYVNLSVVMLLGGLWHGANRVFVAWGLYHGILLGAERCLGRRSVYHQMPRPLRVLLTFVLILFSWVLFRSSTIVDAGSYFVALLGGADVTTASVLISAELYTPLHFIVMAICAVVTVQPVQSFDWVWRPSWLRGLLLLLLFVFAIGEMFTQAFNPFLYFQL